MQIGDLAAKAGVTPRTIRYYVAQKLLPPPGGAGQRRIYGHEHFVRLKLIRRLQEKHLPLDEIKARLAKLSLREMEGLLGSAPRPRKRLSARRLLAAVLRDEGPQRAHEAAPMMLRQAMPVSEALAEYKMVDAPDNELWKRVTLAPGLELHCQQNGDPERDALIAQIVADAAGRLAEAEGDEPSESGGGARKRR